jgi:hypothetical protein
MSEIGLPRSLAGFGAFLRVGQGMQGNTTNGRQDKSADLGRAHVVGQVGFFGDWTNRAYWRLRHKVQGIQRTERRHPPFGGLLLP